MRIGSVSARTTIWWDKPGPALDGQQDQVPSFYLCRGDDLSAADRVEDGSCRTKRTIEEIMDDMRNLHYVLSVKKGSRTPERRLETPSKTQSEVLSAFGYHVDESGVLQQIDR